MGYSKAEAGKKEGKKGNLHTEKVHELPEVVDWEEEERIRASLTGKYLKPVREKSDIRSMRASMYSPEMGTKLVVRRREGNSMRMIAAEYGLKGGQITHWLQDFPEFAQEWNDAYAQYITDVAEELVPRAEKLMEGLKLDGRKLSKVQEKRYLKALEVLSKEAHWAAAARVPQLYGDDSDGGELVLVQPLELERKVTQDVQRAIQWKIETEGVPSSGGEDTGGPDGDGGDAGGPSGGAGAGECGVPGIDPVLKVKRRYKVGGKRLVELSKRKPDDEPALGGDREDTVQDRQHD